MTPEDRSRTCPKCGQPLGGLAPDGVCPRCLLLTGLERTAADQSDRHDAPTPGGVDSLPRRFGDYELLEEITRGGMGIVYRARQLSLDRMVAIKMLLFGRYTSEEFVHRFRIEASAAASLQHPNIVAIHEVGVHQGQHYFAMDLVDGPDLARVAKEKPLPARKAAAYLKSIAEAIQFAHARHILHRDLKPSNILIDSNDQPRVTDFGLAKRLSNDSDLTVTGQMLGTPTFMPPEQASVQRGMIGPASDVYSMGAILYHALTGRAPFVGETLADTLQQVLHQEPIPPRLLAPAVPVDLETICLKCLEKETSKRYATAQELADELGRHLNDEPIHARPVTRLERAWRWCRRNPALAGASSLALMLLLVLATGSTLVAFRNNQARITGRQNLYAADIGTVHREIEEGNFGRAQRLLQQHIPSAGETDLRGFEWRYLCGQLRGQARATIASNISSGRYLCSSADGQLLGAGRQVRNIESRAVVLGLEKDCEILTFGPRDQTLLFRRGKGRETFVRRDLATGHEANLLEHETVAALAFSRTGHWLATGSDRGLRLWDASSWQLAGSITNAPFNFWHSLQDDFAAFNYFSAKGLAFSPDEHLLIVASGYPLAHRSELSAWKIPTLERVPMPSNSVEDATCVAFAPDDRGFVTGHWNGDIRFWDAETLQESSSRRIPNAHRSWIADMAFFKGTLRLVTAGSDRCIRVWDTGTRGDPITLHGHLEEIEAMSLTPGGVIYTVANDNTIKQWLPELPPSSDDALCRFAAPLLPAGLCDDANLLATVSEKTLHFWRIGTPEVTEDVSLRAELTSLGKLPLNWRKFEGMAAVSPNRQWLAVGRPREAIAIVDLTQPLARRTLQGNTSAEQYLAFSPDGRFLVAVRSEHSVAIFDTAKWEEITLIETPGKMDSCFPFHFAEHADVLGVQGAKSVVLWSTATRKTIKEIKADVPYSVISFAISADAKMVAMGYMDDTFTLHDCETGTQVASVPSHVSGVEWIAFSPDGRTLATAGGRWVRLWNIATRREMFSSSLPTMVVFLAFTPDGNGLLTSEMSGRTHLWRAPPLEEVQSFLKVNSQK